MPHVSRRKGGKENRQNWSSLELGLEAEVMHSDEVIRMIRNTGTYKILALPNHLVLKAVRCP